MDKLLTFLKSENSKSSRLHQIDGVWHYPVLGEEKETLEVKELPSEFVEFAEEVSKLI